MSVGRRLLSERVCDNTGLVQALHPILHAHGVQQWVRAGWAGAERWPKRMRPSLPWLRPSAHPAQRVPSSVSILDLATDL